MKKSFKLCMLFVFMIIVTMSLTTNVYATEINDINDLLDVFNGEISVGQKITLSDDYDLGDNVLIVKSGTYEIDLNGHDLTSDSSHAIIVDGANLTISDSGSSLGVISITNENDFAAPVYIESGVLTINNGKIGNSSNASDVGLYINDGTVTVENGKFAGLLHGIYIESGFLTVNDGDFKSTTATESSDAIGIYGGQVIINNGSFTSSDLNGEGGGLYCENRFETDVTINNGTFTGTFSGAQFWKETNEDFSIIINNGTFIGNNTGLVLYNNNLPDIEISAGIFKAVAATESERFGAITIEYETNPPSINDVLKDGSIISPDSTSTSNYTYGDTTYNILRTADEVTVKNTINILESDHGTIIANKIVALPGEEITLTITPEDGYVLKQMIVTDESGQSNVTVTNKKFIMPNHNVLILSEFEEKTDYIFTQGANQKFDKSSKNDLSFTINADYSLLDKVYVDNELLSEDDFSSANGSTIITLKNSYLNTLEARKHTLKVTFTDGKEAISQFEILSEPNPKTGDGIISFIFIGTISLIGLLGINVYLKKKRLN